MPSSDRLVHNAYRINLKGESMRKLNATKNPKPSATNDSSRFRVAALRGVATFNGTGGNFGLDWVATFALEQVATLHGIRTATRREQNLQEIPLAITAISAERSNSALSRMSRIFSLLVPNVDIRGAGEPVARRVASPVRGVRGGIALRRWRALSGDQGSLAPTWSNSSE